MSLAPTQVPEISQLAELLPAFDFDRIIHVGQSGAIYKARQRTLDREVAIKILSHELGDDPLFRTSFEAKAKAMASLSHPNLIRVFDSGDIDGMLYVVMEYVPGKSLHHSAKGKAIDPKQAVQIVLSACRGLTHAHENGIVHRDIKPANILLTQSCEPKIGSFGLAHGNNTNATSPNRNSSYMAQEIVGHPENVSVQSDVYAIGVMLRELLIGTSGEKASNSIPAIADLRLAKICRNATLPDPAARFKSVSELADSLERWLKTGTSRPLVTSQKAFHGPKPSLNRPIRKGIPKKTPSPALGAMKKCAVIAFLLCAIHMLWGAYQTKKETIAQMQLMENAKPATVRVVHLEQPKVVVNSEPLDTSLASEKRSMLVRNID